MPSDLGDNRRVVLDHLGGRYGRHFINNWAFVRFAQEQGLDLDLTTPPKRPDSKESFRTRARDSRSAGVRSMINSGELPAASGRQPGAQFSQFSTRSRAPAVSCMDLLPRSLKTVNGRVVSRPARSRLLS